MGAVVAAIACDYLCHRDHLVFVFVAAAGECSRQIDRAFLHRLRHQLRHLLDLRLRRRPIVEADDDPADLLRRYARRDVDRGPFLAEAAEITVERGPVDVDAGAPLGFLFVFFEHPALERRHCLAFPITSSVTPWRTLLSVLPSARAGMSVCVCRSMKPGETTIPFASITRLPDLGSTLPILTMWPFLIATLP